MEEALEFSKDAIHVTDRDGNLARVNPAFLKLFRYDEASQVIGMPSACLLGESGSPGYASMRDRIAVGCAWEGPALAQAGDGSAIPIHLSAYPLSGEGRSGGSICFSRNRMAEFLMESQINQVAQAAIQGGFALDYSQEINAPLTSILLDAGFLKDVFLKAPAWKRNRMAYDASESVFRSAERMRKLVEHSMFYFGSGSASGPGTLYLGRLLDDAALFFERKLAARGIVFEVDCPHGLRMIGNRLQLESVLIQLISNAYDAFDGKDGPKRILVRVRQVKVGIALEFSDNAGGIPEGILPRVFEPFFTTKADPHTGFGLPACRRIVAKHGGAMECLSSNGETVFRITLPA